MAGIFRIQEWSFTTKCVVFAVNTTLVPPLILGALGFYNSIHTLSTVDHLVYLGGAVVAGGLALMIFRSFSQQADRIVQLAARLKEYSVPSTSSVDGGQASDENAGGIGKAWNLFRVQEATLAASTATVQDLTTSIEHMAAQVARSATAAEHTVTYAQQGSATVQHTLQGIRMMYIQLQDAAKRIQHLETHADEVREIGQRIADLADSASVLALNVSVQALRPSTDGADAAIGASEVERLADRTASATQRIAHLVHTIQRETTEVVGALEVRAAELRQWTEATFEAQQVLQEIQESADQLTTFIQATSQAVAQQASNSATLAKAIDDMSIGTQQSAAWTRQAATSMSNLSLLVGSLHTAINGEKAA